MRLKYLGVALLAMFSLVGVGLAQSSKGILAGVVRDQTGAVVAGAQVTVTNQLTNVSRTENTNGSGAYRIEGIDPGPYAIHVSETGFAPVDTKNLLVTASQVTSFNPTLVVGSSDATVEVNALSNEVNTENGRIGGTISQEALAKIPNFTLSPVALAAILPGVSPVNQGLGLGGAGGNGVQIQVNGARPRSNNFMLDGQDINDIGIGGQAFQPSLGDAFQQETVLTSSTSAEFGRTGGAVVNSITKTGTNQFHGTVWELYQGSGLDSQDGQSRQAAGAPKARFDEHSYGALVGGPIVRDKLFAFGGTQFQRFYGNGQASPIFLPDQASYNLIKAIGGPQSTLLQQYLGNGTYLTTYAPSTAGQSYNISPRPGCPNGCTINTLSWVRPPVPQQNPDTQWIVRVDYTPRSADTFTYRYLHDNTFLTPDLGTNTSGLPEFDNTQGGPSELAQGGWTHVFSPNLINELRVGETRIRFAFAPLPATVNGPLGSAPNLNFSDSNGIGDLGVDQNLPQGRDEDLYQFQDTVGWTIGRQSLRIGVDIGRQLEKDLVSQNHFGYLTFSKVGTATTPALSKLDNFLNDRIGGSGGTAGKSFGPTRIDPHAYKVAAFIQDDIKLTPDFALNLGLRYDYQPPIENSLPYPAIDTSNPFLPIATVIKVRPDKNNFGPRFGFAYAPSDIGLLKNTSIRGGFGVFYDVDFSNIAINGAQSAPNSPTGTIVSTTLHPVDAPASTLLASISPNLTPKNSVLSVSSHLVNPITYQYNLGIERTLPAALKLAINYVGTRSLKLFANQQYNYFDANTGLRLNPNRGAVSARINDGVSNYNGLQVSVSRQFQHGLYLESNYVYSKLLDNSSEVFALFTSQTSYGAQLAPGKRGQEWGNSAFDHRHFFSVAYVYAPTGFRSGNTFANGLLSVFTRNFTFSGLTQLQSGSYSSFQINGIDTNGDGNPVNDRPLIGNPHAPLNTAGIDGAWVGGTPGDYYDMATAQQTDENGNSILKPVTTDSVHFLIPAGGAEITPHELRKNSFSNPGTTTWNFAVEKDVPVSRLTHLEHGALQFRVEAENVFNHNDVGVLGTDLLTIGTPAYMNISAARDTRNRVLHLWAKFAF